MRSPSANALIFFQFKAKFFGSLTQGTGSHGDLTRGQARCEVLIYENTKLYVPTGTLELYKNADCWKKYITRRNLVRQEMCYNLKSSMH